LEDIITTIDEEIQRVFGETRVGLNLESRLRRRADEEQFVIFTLAGAEYAVSAANVREVSEVVNLSPAPNVPDWLLGVTNLRGDILSVVDLREFLGLEPSGLGGVLWPQSLAGAEQKILVVHPSRDSSALTTAMLVDEVKDIRYLTTRDINKPATTVTEQIESYLRGIYDDDGRLLVVFDFDKLLLSPEMRQFEPM
jgi:purine-binding chemotaxis protein CheW